jgi:hypothetical protein
MDSSQILTDVLKSGYLEKKGSGMLSGWKSRYFELGAQFLAYFENEEKKELLAAVDLSQVCVLVPRQHTHITPRVFLLHLQVESVWNKNPTKPDFLLQCQGSKMHLKAPSADEAAEWVQAIAPLLLSVAPGEGPAQSR